MTIAEKLDTIESHVIAFREAILRIPTNHRPPSFESFPLGACGDATLLVGTFLEDSGFGSFNLISAARGKRNTPPYDWVSHAWATKDHIVIDITSDQFYDFPGGYVFAKESDFHKSFSERLSNGIANFRKYDDNTTRLLSTYYQAITASLKGKLATIKLSP